MLHGRFISLNHGHKGLQGEGSGVVCLLTNTIDMMVV